MIAKLEDCYFKVCYFWIEVKETWMKKLLIPVMVIAICVALYEQNRSDKNVYIIVIAIAIFMLGMMKLSSKTPSKNQESEDDNV